MPAGSVHGNGMAVSVYFPCGSGVVVVVVVFVGAEEEHIN